jgi:hypothetical protein
VRACASRGATARVGSRRSVAHVDERADERTRVEQRGAHGRSLLVARGAALVLQIPARALAPRERDDPRARRRVRDERREQRERREEVEALLRDARHARVREDEERALLALVDEDGLKDGHPGEHALGDAQRRRDDRARAAGKDVDPLLAAATGLAKSERRRRAAAGAHAVSDVGARAGELACLTILDPRHRRLRGHELPVAHAAHGGRLGGRDGVLRDNVVVVGHEFEERKLLVGPAARRDTIDCRAHHITSRTDGRFNSAIALAAPTLATRGAARRWREICAGLSLLVRRRRIASPARACRSAA